jgi:hypothetical protein
LDKLQEIRQQTKSSGPMYKDKNGKYSDEGLFGDPDNVTSEYKRYCELKRRLIEIENLKEQIRLKKLFGIGE